jgi:isopenicillin N synthase-like dioxygenase
MQHELPVIDLGLLRSEAADDRRTVASALRDVCQATGFFYVANHGIDRAAQDTLFAASRQFFDQPLAIKRAFEMPGRGYEAMGTQFFDDAPSPDRKESMTIGVELSPDHPLARLLMSGIALSLDLPWRHFDPCLETHMSSLRLLHYPPHPEADAAREVGCGAHTDWGAITVLAQDASGLEIRHAAGHWIAAPVVPGTFIVNLGDMMARWTNDLYASTPHRVLNRSPRDRYSAAFFFDPAFHTRVECLPTCRSAERPVRYPPITSGEHLAEMHRRTHPRPTTMEALP